MKLYLSALLLFLLIDNSLSAGVRLPRFSKTPYRPTRGQETFKNLWDKTIDNIKQKFSPQQSNSPPKQINGLSSIKDYLYDFGYLQYSPPFNDTLDDETISAIKTYQQYFNLQVTGDLNNETFQQLSLPRCAVPDMNFDYSFTDNVSWPKSGKHWFPKGKTNLTYGFLRASEIPPNATKVFRDAFTRWANATTVLNLTETTYDNADIKVGFYVFNESVEDVVLGGSIIRLQPVSNVKTGEIRLDGTRYWALPSENDSVSWQDGVLDLETVAMHQIGHLLGLDHSKMEDSVMYPNILASQQIKVQLSNSNKDNIQQQYAHAANANAGDRGRRGSLVVTTLSLVLFAYMVLLY